jgi:hypothetical protein
MDSHWLPSPLHGIYNNDTSESVHLSSLERKMLLSISLVLFDCEFSETRDYVSIQ